MSLESISRRLGDLRRQRGQLEDRAMRLLSHSANKKITPEVTELGKLVENLNERIDALELQYAALKYGGPQQ